MNLQYSYIFSPTDATFSKLTLSNDNIYFLKWTVFPVFMTTSDDNLINLCKSFKYKACTVWTNDTTFCLKKSPKKPPKNRVHSLKFPSTQQINWLCRWRRHALLRAKSGIERLSGAASHQSFINYVGCLCYSERSNTWQEGGWKAEPRIPGNYLLKLGSVCLSGCCLHEKNMNHLYPVRFNSISLARDTSGVHPS